MTDVRPRAPQKLDLHVKGRRVYAGVPNIHSININPILECGDGKIVDTKETCDDSNTVAGDGCSDLCATEAGWTCNGAPSVC